MDATLFTRDPGSAPNYGWPAFEGGVSAPHYEDADENNVVRYSEMPKKLKGSESVQAASGTCCCTARPGTAPGGPLPVVAF